MRTLRLLWTFYRLYYILSLIINLASAVITITWGMGPLTALIWLKLFTLGITYFSLQNSSVFSYFKNLGLGKSQLWWPTLIFDFMVFLFLQLLIIKMR